MKTQNLYFAALVVALLIGCGGENSHRKPGVERTENLKIDVAALLAQEDDIVRRAPRASNNQLAFDLYLQLKDEDNLTVSPFSISLALAMAYAGAKGDTESAMKNVLHFGENTVDFHKSYGQFANLLSSKDRSASETTFKVSNQQWLQKDYNILADYIDVLLQSYVAGPVYLDFKLDPVQATKAINESVAKQTNGEIPRLLKSDLKRDTRLVLTNAIYFNAKWENEFKTFQTHDGEFASKKGGKVTVSYMKQQKHYAYSGDSDRQVLMMPYRDDDFAAVFILPREGKLSAVESKLTSDEFSRIIDSLESTEVDIWLPKFAQRTSPRMKEVLTKMGLGIIFDEEKVDLSKINGITNGLEKLYISDVVHEAVVKVYEAGTTAAAATGVIAVGVTSMPEPSEPVAFHATRPFLFYLIHKDSKTILFMGRVDKPVFSENL